MLSRPVWRVLECRAFACACVANGVTHLNEWPLALAGRQACDGGFVAERYLPA